jgi:ketosteroid isomerase-like protein
MQKIALPIVVVVFLSACNQPKQETVSVLAPVETGDSAKANLCKASYAALIAGNVDQFAKDMSNDAIFVWNSGDSLVGKAAILEYWKDRRANVIDKLEIRDDVWLPLKVNKLTNLPSGEYVMMWANLTSIYQFGGRPAVQRFHQVYRFNREGKIDYVEHYLDRHEVAEALPPQRHKNNRH